MTISRGNPQDWRALQRQVHQILGECGFESKIENRVQTVRGDVTIDVYARDPSSQPPIIYLCECKLWQSRVPQTVVHAFRTVVTDHGANWGFIISSAGFQRAAYKAAANSNVKLLTWNEFQEIFTDRWVSRYMAPRLRSETESLVEYIEPFNARVFRKADRLPESSQKRFAELREKWASLGFLAQHLFVGIGFLGESPPQLPLRAPGQTQSTRYENLPEEVLDATCFRDFVDNICRIARSGIEEFDQLFGERA